ncbi:hypothetical protein E2C01_035747 [Portunus trituberculatus]|uniref:Uncharacterized protein n=1 Tax=Portunus trituberculatus TaxID=210409 RepID=A0A5B7FAK0_PORTR|nr:hypothetical protein [Portunus trituberculatus]
MQRSGEPYSTSNLAYSAVKYYIPSSSANTEEGGVEGGHHRTPNIDARERMCIKKSCYERVFAAK